MSQRNHDSLDSKKNNIVNAVFKADAIQADFAQLVAEQKETRTSLGKWCESHHQHHACQQFAIDSAAESATNARTISGELENVSC